MSNFQRIKAATLPDVSSFTNQERATYDALVKRGADENSLRFWASINHPTPNVPKKGTAPESYSYWREKSISDETIEGVDDISFEMQEFGSLALSRIVYGHDKKLAINFLRDAQECLRTWICAEMNWDADVEEGALLSNYSDRIFELRGFNEFLDAAIAGIVKGTDFYWIAEHHLFDLDSDKLMYIRNFMRNGFLQTMDNLSEQFHYSLIRTDKCRTKDHTASYCVLDQFVAAIHHKMQDAEIEALTQQASV